MLTQWFPNGRRRYGQIGACPASIVALSSVGTTATNTPTPGTGAFNVLAISYIVVGERRVKIPLDAAIKIIEDL